MPPLQCLFCNHLNPAGASFCNDCGSQMHLQPCDRCGAVDKRTARNCYKCGAGFTLPAASEINSAPALVASQTADPSMDDFDRAQALTTLIPVQLDETLSLDKGAMASGPRRTWRVAAMALLLLMIAVAVYFYMAQSVQRVSQPRPVQLPPSVSGGPITSGATPSPGEAPVDAASVPVATPRKLGAATSEPDEARPLAPAGAGAAMTARPSSVTGAEANVRQDPPIFKECPQAVAALGFCSPDTKQEKQ